jgi:hypothetical protein
VLLDLCTRAEGWRDELSMLDRGGQNRGRAAVVLLTVRDGGEGAYKWSRLALI